MDKENICEGWSFDKLIKRANNILEVIGDEGISKNNINRLEETFELIISRLKLIAFNDDDLLRKKKKDIEYMKLIKPKWNINSYKLNEVNLQI